MDVLATDLADYLVRKGVSGRCLVPNSRRLLIMVCLTRRHVGYTLALDPIPRDASRLRTGGRARGGAAVPAQRTDPTRLP